MKHETCQCVLLWLWMSVGVGVTTCVGWENIRLCFGKTNWFNWYVAKNIFKNWVVDPSQTPSRSWSPSPQKHRSEPPKDASNTAQLGFLIVDLHLAAEREKNICEMSQKNHLPQEITRPIFRRSVFPSLSWMAIPWKLSNENGWT